MEVRNEILQFLFGDLNFRTTCFQVHFCFNKATTSDRKYPNKLFQLLQWLGMIHEVIYRRKMNYFTIAFICFVFSEHKTHSVKNAKFEWKPIIGKCFHKFWHYIFYLCILLLSLSSYGCYFLFTSYRFGLAISYARTSNLPDVPIPRTERSETSSIFDLTCPIRNNTRP